MATGRITPKQEAFCVEYVASGSGVAAYRASYAADKMGDVAIDKEVAVLLNKPLVAERIAELLAPRAQNVPVADTVPDKATNKAPVTTRPPLTLESHLERLAHLSEMAESANQMSPAITAEVHRGKAAGLYVERVNLDVKTDIGEVDKKIAALLKKLDKQGRASRS
jgi:hypothetical protein